MHRSLIIIFSWVSMLWKKDYGEQEKEEIKYPDTN